MDIIFPDGDTYSLTVLSRGMDTSTILSILLANLVTGTGNNLLLSPKALSWA